MPHFSMNIHNNTEYSRIFCIVPLQNSKSEIRTKIKTHSSSTWQKVHEQVFSMAFSVPLESNNKFIYKTPMVKQAN